MGESEVDTEGCELDLAEEVELQAMLRRRSVADGCGEVSPEADEALRRMLCADE